MNLVKIIICKLFVPLESELFGKMIILLIKWRPNEPSVVRNLPCLAFVNVSAVNLLCKFNFASNIGPLLDRQSNNTCTVELKIWQTTKSVLWLNYQIWRFNSPLASVRVSAANKIVKMLFDHWTLAWLLYFGALNKWHKRFT